MKHISYSKIYTIGPNTLKDISYSSGIYDVLVKDDPLKIARIYFTKNIISDATIVILPSVGVGITKGAINSINIYKENDLLIVENNTSIKIEIYVKMESY